MEDTVSFKYGLSKNTCYDIKNLDVTKKCTRHHYTFLLFDEYECAMSKMVLQAKVNFKVQR